MRCTPCSTRKVLPTICAALSLSLSLRVAGSVSPVALPRCTRCRLNFSCQTEQPKPSRSCSSSNSRKQRSIVVVVRCCCCSQEACALKSLNNSYVGVAPAAYCAGGKFIICAIATHVGNMLNSQPRTGYAGGGS